MHGRAQLGRLVIVYGIDIPAKVGDTVAYHGVPSSHYTVVRLNGDRSVSLRPVRDDGVMDIPHRSTPTLLKLVERGA